jgi:hypothetical protein
MRYKLRTVIFAMILAVSFVIIFYFLNIIIMCQTDKPVDFVIFKIDCESIPNKQLQFEDAFNMACEDFKINHSCKLEDVDKISINYTEFQKPTRAYTLVEMCQLKNPYYYVDLLCGQLCGCKY